MMMDQARFQEQPSSEKGYRIAQIDLELFGIILARIFEGANEAFKEADILSRRRASLASRDFLIRHLKIL